MSTEKEFDIPNFDGPRKEASVREYSPPSFSSNKAQTYKEAKKDFGVVSKFDADRPTKERKDHRFQLNADVSRLLNVTAEEQKVIQEQVNEQVEALAEAARVEAAARGYAEGLEAGKKEAFQAMQKDSDIITAELREVVQNFEGLRNQMFETNEKMLVTMMFRVCRMVLLKELDQDREGVLKRLLRNLVARTGTRENIQIYINPKDLQYLEQLRGDLTAEFGTLKNLSIESSDEVQLGGCRLETDNSDIDARIETQLSRLEEALVPTE
jgi:flagellar assembly protein FliH